MNAADVQVFSRVAQTGNFSEAAEQLGLTRSAISKCIIRLEERLGVVLINRSTRSSSLTDAGRRFYKYAREVDDALEKAIAAVSGEDQDVVGNLSICMPTSVGAAMTPAIANEFLQAWPRLTLSLYFADNNVDLIGGGIDVAIRIARRLSDSNLLSKRLGTTRGVLVASPGYLARYGSPGTLEDLKNHRCIDRGRPGRSRVVWRFDTESGTTEVPVDYAINSNTDLPLILATCMNQGIFFTQKIAISNELAQGRLTEILPDYTRSQRWGVYAVYPNHGPPAKVRAFVDFLERQLPQLATCDRWSPFDQQGQSPDCNGLQPPPEEQRPEDRTPPLR